MSALLPHHRPGWIWPSAWFAAAVLVVLATLVPHAWWWLLIPDRNLTDSSPSSFGPTFELVELEVVAPPPVVLVTRDLEKTDPLAPEPHLDPDWWTRSWDARIDADLARRRSTLPDSLLLPQPLLDIWGAQATVELILAQPDSVVQARIWRLVQAEELTRDDADGLFSAIARARSYADMKSREAAMYDEFIFETVPVPK